MSSRIVIAREKCISCGVCLNGCSARNFLFDQSHQGPQLVPDADQRCIGCFHCICLCPVGAVTVDGVTADQAASLQPANLPTLEQFAELVRTRRSIRNYKQESVRQEDLDRLFALLRYAPTAKNLHPLRWLIVNQRETVQELSGLAIEGVRGDDRYTGMVEAWDNGYDWICRGAPCVAIAVAGPDANWFTSDGAIAAETLDLGASLLGLGACWAGLIMVFLARNPVMRKRLGIADDEKIAAALMLGYPEAETYTTAPPRPDPELIYIK